MLTPDQLRAMTLAANMGFESNAAALAAFQEEARLKSILEKFEKNALEAAGKGEHEAIVYETEVPHDSKHGGFERLSQSDRDMISRLKLYFENLGYSTRIHGPYVDGGPSKPWTGYDLYVIWK